MVPKETERLLDLLEKGKLKRRIDTNIAEKLEQKNKLKDMLLADQIPLRRYMNAMGALNITLDKKTKDMINMRGEDPEGHQVHRRRTMENVANLVINNQIQLISPPDGVGYNIGGGVPRGRGRGRGARGRGRGRGRA